MKDFVKPLSHQNVTGCSLLLFIYDSRKHFLAIYLHGEKNVKNSIFMSDLRLPDSQMDG